MKAHRCFVCLGAILLAALCTAAQERGNISSIELQTPKSGMAKQYEEGRKAKAAWHKQQKDTQPLIVLEVMSGEHTGSYLVGRFNQHWADFDTPSVTDAADLEQYNKVVSAYVERLSTAYYEYMPKESNPGPEGDDKYTSVTVFHIRFGKGDDFRSAITRMHDAAEKTKWPFHYEWQRLVNGGPGGTYVLLVHHANWASFADDPNVKPLRDILREAFGEQEAMSVIERLNGSIESTYSEIVQFRPDLSYIPRK
jgi:hypothetical protein